VPYSQGRVTDDCAVDNLSSFGHRSRATVSCSASTSAHDSVEDVSGQVLGSGTTLPTGPATAVVNWFDHMHVSVNLAEPWDIHTVSDVKHAVANDLATFASSELGRHSSIPSLGVDSFSLVYKGTILADDTTLYEAGVVSTAGVLQFQAVQGVVARESGPHPLEWSNESGMKVSWCSHRPCADKDGCLEVEGLMVTHPTYGSLAWEGSCTIPLSLDVTSVTAFSPGGVDIAPTAPHGVIHVTLAGVEAADLEVLQSRIAACGATFVSYSTRSEKLRFVVSHGVVL
jgi:hypothetical protein